MGVFGVNGGSIGSMEGLWGSVGSMEGQWGQRRVCGGQWRVSGGLWGQLPPFLPLKGTWAAAAEEVDVCYARALSGFLMVLSDGGDMIFLSENVSRLLGLGQVSVQGH